MTREEQSPLIFALCVDIDAEREQDFNHWYDTDHLPAILTCPGIISGRRYTAERVGRGALDLATYWAFYEVESEEAMHSPEITALAADGFGSFADSVRHVRRYWFRPIQTTAGDVSVNGQSAGGRR